MTSVLDCFLCEEDRETARPRASTAKKTNRGWRARPREDSREREREQADSKRKKKIRGLERKNRNLFNGGGVN
ncbi:hypothetical protein Syun_000657 [Stephania yunnanensis]|uniref:Uncharacterized protein n=1 Tax=Stephania yunnanensis TaxID=152371 RepID=A0AAP0Q5I6_9MAGN